jgi:SnoaL-like polyketide cyclase
MSPTASVQEKNKAVVLQMLEAFNKRDPAVVPKLLAANARSQSTFPLNRALQKQPLAKRLQEEILRTAGGGATGPVAFPDGQYRVKELIAEGDKVILIWEMTGTHSGELFGRAATGRKITVSGYEVVQLKNGKMVSHYDNHGTQTVLEVLGKLGMLDKEMVQSLGLHK